MEHATDRISSGTIKNNVRGSFPTLNTANGNDQSVTEIGNSLKRRDQIDSSRKKDPLKVADNAMIIDSTGKSIDDVVKIICDAVSEQ